MRARLTCVVFALVALALPALAADRRGGGSLDRVLPEIRRSVPGTFYDAEGPFLTPDGRATYHVKWMTPDGRIIWFTVDARSGQIVGGTPGQQPRPRFREDSNWADRRNDFNNDDRKGWGNDQGGDRDRGGWDGNGGWGNDRGGLGRDNGNNRGNDRGGWNNGRGNDRGGRGNDRSGHGGGRGGGDHRHGG